MKKFEIAKIMSFVVLIIMISSSTLVVSAYSSNSFSNTSSLVSQYSISETVKALEKQTTDYGISLNYYEVFNATENDIFSLVNRSNFVSYVDSYGNNSINWNLAYNARDSNLSVFFQIVQERGQYIVDYSWGASSNGWIETSPNVTIEENATYSSNSWGPNWAGYEFYDTNSLYPLTYSSAGLNVSTISYVSESRYAHGEGMGAWIGFTQYPGGNVTPGSPPSSNAILAQTGYGRLYNGTGPWGPYYIWYETLNNNSAPPYRYGGSPNLSPGYDLAFSINNNGNGTVTYGATIGNTSQFFTSAPQKFSFSTLYGQFIVEAPGDFQLADFSPTEIFQDPVLSGPNRVSNQLNNLYSNGYYTNYLMNQTLYASSFGLSPSQNQNVLNVFKIVGGWGEPEMTYNNSKYA